MFKILYNRCVGLISLKYPLQHFSPLKVRLAEMEMRNKDNDKEDENSSQQQSSSENLLTMRRAQRRRQVMANSVGYGHDISESDLEVGEELYNDSKSADCPGSKFSMELPPTEEDIVKCFNIKE